MLLYYLGAAALPRSAYGEDLAPLVPGAGRRPIIVLVRQPGDELMMEAVRSESLRFGWEVRDAALASSTLLRDTPIAEIRYLAASRKTHLSIRVADGSASSLEEWSVRMDGSPVDVLAIRVVEILRAHFLLGLRGPPGPVRVRTELRRPELPGAMSRPSAFWASLAVGGAGYGSMGGLTPMGGVVLGAKVGAGGWFAGVTGVWQLGSANVREPEGSASVRTFGALAHVGRRIPLGARYDAFAGAGAAVWAASIHGTAEPPYVPRSVTPWTVGPSASFALECAVAPNFRTGLALHGGTTLPPLSIQFVDRETAQWGAPFVLLALYGAMHL